MSFKLSCFMVHVVSSVTGGDFRRKSFDLRLRWSRVPELRGAMQPLPSHFPRMRPAFLVLKLWRQHIQAWGSVNALLLWTILRQTEHASCWPLLCKENPPSSGPGWTEDFFTSLDFISKHKTKLISHTMCDVVSKLTEMEQYVLGLYWHAVK